MLFRSGRTNGIKGFRGKDILTLEELELIEIAAGYLKEDGVEFISRNRSLHIQSFSFELVMDVWNNVLTQYVYNILLHETRN